MEIVKSLLLIVYFMSFVFTFCLSLTMLIPVTKEERKRGVESKHVRFLIMSVIPIINTWLAVGILRNKIEA